MAHGRCEEQFLPSALTSGRGHIPMPSSEVVYALAEDLAWLLEECDRVPSYKRGTTMSDGKLKAIETSYKGCRFRSRLEAKWAVFFDHLGLAWDYEPQGFDVEGVRYLPDFRIHAFECWFEIKPESDDDFSKPWALAKAGEHIVVLQGNPW